MPACIVKGCNFQWRNKDPSIILHSFPNDLEAIKAWLVQTKQEFGNIDEMSQKILVASRGQFRMCSQHFTRDCYFHRGMVLSLKKEALPTIFPDKETIEANAKRRRRRRRKVALPDGDPSLALEAGIPVGVVKVEQDDPMPISEQGAEPGTYPALIAEDGYYISEDFYIRKRKRVSYGSGREAFPTKYKSTKSGIPPRPNMTPTNRNVGEHKAAQTDLSKGSSMQCKCKKGTDQAKATPSGITLQGTTGKVPAAQSAEVLPDVSGRRDRKSAELGHPSDARSSRALPMATKKPPVMVSVACGPDSAQRVSLPEGVCAVKTENDPQGGGGTVKTEDDPQEEQVGDVEIKAEETDLASENKYIIFESCLDRLLMQCRCLADKNCNGSILRLEKSVVGSRLSVSAECLNHHQFHMWDSQL